MKGELGPRHALALALNTLFFDSPVRIASYFSLFESLAMLQANWSLLAAELPDRLRVVASQRWQAFDVATTCAQCHRHGVSLVFWDSPYYPSLLKELNDAPPVFYARGRLSVLQGDALAVVGSRAMTDYGRQVTAALVAGLAPYMTIVSGLALGVDGIAHQVALDQGGHTVAVLATGLDVIYPSAHHELAEAITQRGVLMSEYPVGTPGAPYRFPQRNRIISGISRGVLVTESGIKGGAMLTAADALSQNREVLAVPGSIMSALSEGPNQLIKQGAKCVTTPSDLVTEWMSLPLKPGGTPRATDHMLSVSPVAKGPSFHDPSHQLVWDCLATHTELNEIVTALGQPVHVVLPILTLLELNGHIELASGNRYLRRVSG